MVVRLPGLAALHPMFSLLRYHILPLQQLSVCRLGPWPGRTAVTVSSVLSHLQPSQHAVMNSLSPPAHVVPGLYSHSDPASTPQSSPAGSLDVPWFARPPQTSVCSEEEMYPHYPLSPHYQAQPLNLIMKKPRRKTLLCSVKEPKLPSDPRRWSRAEVCSWVEWTCLSHSLPSPSVDRFLMNGKAVCLMSVQMFSNRVPLGGKLLYRDFQIRLAKALYKK